MKASYVVLVLFLLLIASCSAAPKTITGTVVDADNGTPIEGAAVLVEWTKTHGIGDHHTEVYKVVEKLSGKEGRITIEGVDSIFVDPPEVTVYKKGYVAWNSESIFPDYRKRRDFKWKDGYVFKLEQFKPEYSYVEHDSFVRGSVHSHMGLAKKQLFMRVYNDGEMQERIDERNRKMNLERHK